ncbi:unnamed protein product, partial [Discosporangium mesarthrocarpum]
LENTPVFENSHRKEAANEVGCLGEVVFEAFLNHHGINYSDERNLTSHDYTVGNKLSLDVKTKDRTVIPKIGYDNSVPIYNHEHQRVDYYYFISLLRDKNIDPSDIRRFTNAYILGGISRELLHKHGIVWKAGDVDSRNGTKFWTDCINVSMGDLIENRKMLEILQL